MAYCLINKSNYYYNLSRIEKKIDRDKIAVVIKNNAYGHGLIEIAKLASEYGIKHAVVCSLNEALIVSSLFKTILVLQDLPKKEVPKNSTIVCGLTGNGLKDPTCAINNNDASFNALFWGFRSYDSPSY